MQGGEVINHENLLYGRAIEPGHIAQFREGRDKIQQHHLHLKKQNGHILQK